MTTPKTPFDPSEFLHKLYPHIDFSDAYKYILIAGASALAFYVLLRCLCWFMDQLAGNQIGYTWASLFGADRKLYDDMYKEDHKNDAAEEKEKFMKERKLSSSQIAKLEPGDKRRSHIDESLKVPSSKRQKEMMKIDSDVEVGDMFDRQLSRSDASYEAEHKKHQYSNSGDY